MNIPEKLWYVYSGHIESDKALLVYLTHYADNHAFNKRKATALRWTALKESTGQIITNVVLSGYKVMSNESRTTTSNVVWRILDPRGFEFEVSSNNMMDIIKYGKINNGNIGGNCIIGIDSCGGPTLLLDGTNQFNRDNAVKLIPQIGKVYSIKGINHVYVGQFYSVSNGTKTKNKYHTFIRLSVSRCGFVYLYKSVPSSIIHKENVEINLPNLSIDFPLQYVNQMITLGKMYVVSFVNITALVTSMTP